MLPFSKSHFLHRIDDQVTSCKKLAAQRGFTVDESLIFPDEATSGARSDRKGLAALLAASEAKKFDLVLVDDLSRLARDNYLMLSLMAELHFNRHQKCFDANACPDPILR